MNSAESIELAKAWTLGNKFRKASLIRQHNLKAAFGKDGKTLSLVIGKTLSKDKYAVVPALDENEKLVFFTGHPPTMYDPKDIWSTPKTPKKTNTRPAKPIIKPKKKSTSRTRKESISYKFLILKELFPNESDFHLEAYNDLISFNLDSFMVSEIKDSYNRFVKTIDEKTEYQISAIDINGKEYESDWYSSEDFVSNNADKLDNDDQWETISIIKRITGLKDSDTEDEEEIKLTLVKKPEKKPADKEKKSDDKEKKPADKEKKSDDSPSDDESVEDMLNNI